MTLVVIVPLAFILTIPGLCVAITVLAFALPQLVYVYFADPNDSERPQFASTIRRCLQVDYALWKISTEGLGVGIQIIRDFFLRKIQRRSNFKVSRDVDYGVDGLRLDVYTPQFDGPRRTDIFAPVIVFIPPQIRPFSSRKLIFSSLGANIAEVVKAVVVIPDVTNYPEGRIRRQTEDIRAVLQWASSSIHKYGGDIHQIYLSGMGIGGLIALLVPLQSAIVQSREQILEKDETGASQDLPTGVVEVKEYGQEIRLPPLRGLLLFSPVTNVDEQVTDEANRGMQHLSTTRRVLGPSERSCYFHSPAHLLYAARNIVNLALLPSKFLFIHGGLDRYIDHKQSETMKEILRGVGIQDANIKLYTAGHWGTILSVMCDMEGPPVMDEIHDFIWNDDSPTPRLGTSSS
ncbi:alpha/beta-hydrolase [Serendipita vermifera]|nr:alpha/beta-hydrolase [Serendipita vermifera]